MPRRRAQDARVRRQVPLGQRGHHAARAGAGDAQAHRVPDGERLALPGVLGEARLAGGVHHEVRAEPPHLEAAPGVQRAQPVERGGGEQVDHRQVEEGARRQREVGDRVAVVEPLHVRPVLLGRGRPRVGGGGRDHPLLGALGGLEAHRPAQHARQGLVELTLLARKVAQGAGRCSACYG